MHQCPADSVTGMYTGSGGSESHSIRDASALKNGQFRLGLTEQPPTQTAGGQALKYRGGGGVTTFKNVYNRLRPGHTWYRPYTVTSGIRLKFKFGVEAPRLCSIDKQHAHADITLRDTRQPVWRASSVMGSGETRRDQTPL
ncbi:hypothetical protein BaRGS_00005938 [Batillaria attramentaria]|uniref:Uncharacterized protein n=1 Tax=Batillaria attramentaria TaxID=370345 RepID=A0ABD0LTI1_9CAEN